ncbi:MAG: polysaccharide deacetylase family protein [Bacteroidales bacterium]
MLFPTIVLAACALVLVLRFYQPFVAVRLVQKLLPDLTLHQPGERPVVALTLDDGPDPDVTPLVLDVLKAEGVKATWFVMGARVVAYPELYRRIVAEGHQVANHFWDDTATWRMDRTRFRDSLARTEAVIDQERKPFLYRPASGWFRPWAFAEAAQLEYRTVLGSAYASDPLRPPPRYIRWALARMARPGAILVLHVGTGREATPAVLPLLIADVRAKGLEFVRLDDLLTAAASSIPPAPGA